MAYGKGYMREIMKECPDILRQVSVERRESNTSFDLWSSVSSFYSVTSQPDPFFELELTETLLDNIPKFVEDVNVGYLITALARYMDKEAYNSIKAATEIKERATKFLKCIQSVGDDSHANKMFRSLIAGAYPMVFRSSVKRMATEEEADYFPMAFQKFMKKHLRQKESTKDGHVNTSDDKAPYIKLKIIKKEVPTENGIDGEHKEQGSIKTGDGTEEEIDLSEFVKRESVPLPKGKKLLIKGKCGVGKSSTVEYLNDSWINDKWNPGYTLVILINMGKWVHVKQPVSMMNVLTTILGVPLTDVDEFFLSGWLNNWSRHIMLFMDGVDEIEHWTNKLSPSVDITDASQKGMPLDVFLNILHGNLLPEATVLYTSRQFEGLNQLPCEGVAEIKGFEDSAIDSYVVKVFKKAPEDGKMVNRVLRKQGIAKTMCSLPFYCKEITQILQENPGSFSEEVETRTRLTALIITKHLQRNIIQEGKKALTLDEKMKSLYLLRVAELAYDGFFHTKKDSHQPKMMFTETDIREANLTNEDLEQAVKDNLLISVQASADQFEPPFQFAHQSFQEMLAMALFIGRHSYHKDQRKRVFTEMEKDKDGRFVNARLFLYGLAYDTNSQFVQRLKEAFVDHDQNDQHEARQQEKKTYKMLHDSLMKMCKVAREQQLERLREGGTVSHQAARQDQQGNVLLETVKLANECRTKALELEMSRELFAKNTKMVLHDVNMESVDMLGLVSVISQTTSIHTISISNTYLDHHAMKVFSSFLSDNHSVEELSLCGTGREGLKPFALMLSVNKTIKNLYLERNGLIDDDLRDLHSGLGSLKTLRVLSLRQNKITEDGLSMLGQSLIVNTQLTALHLDSNDLTDEAKKAIHKCLSNKARLRTFSLKMNTLSDDSASDIADVIRKCKDLEHVDLSHNQFGTNGAKIILKELKKKTILDFGVNQIAVHELRELKNVQVYGNTFGSRRVQIVTTSIKNGSIFKILNLEGIHLTDESFSTVAEVLVGNSKLAELKLAGNSLTRRSVMALNRIAFTCPELKGIDVSKNYMDKIVVESFKNIKRYTAQGLSELASTDEASLKKAKKTQVVAVRLVDITPGKMISIDRTKLDSMRLTVLDLTDVKLSRDMVSHLTTSLEKNVGVRKMELANCGLSTRDVESICQLLCEGTKLLHLGLSSNDLILESIYYIIQVFQRNEYLRSLNLSHNSIGAKGIQLLFEASESDGKIEILDVSSNRISEEQQGLFTKEMRRQKLKNIKMSSCVGQDAIPQITELVRSRNEVSYLDISSNRIGPTLAKELGEALRLNDTIKVLDLSDNKLGKRGVEFLSQGLAGNSRLVSLILRKNALGEDGAEIVGNKILRLNNIACLDISENGIGSRGLQALEPGLWDNQSLVSLNLSNNMIRDDGAKHLVSALKDKANLISLNLSSNPLLAAGAKSIARVLNSQNTRIAYLDMSNNAISDEGVHYLVEAMLKNSSLTELNLAKNSIQVRGAKELLRGLCKNKVLTRLDLSENWLNDEAMEFIGELIKVNKTLTSLDLSENDIGHEGVGSLVQALRSGTSLTALDWNRNTGISEMANEALHVAFLGKKS